MRRFLFFRPISNHLLLCVILSLLWVVTNSSTTSEPSSVSRTQTTGEQGSIPKEAASTTITTATTPTTPPTTTPTTPPPTPPPDVNNVTVVTRNETTITLKWEKVNNILTYNLTYGGFSEEINAISSPDPITHVVSNLTAGTKYSFTLFTVFNGLTSSGYKFTAVTVPRNPTEFYHTGQNESSISLRWTAVNGISNYILSVNGTDKNLTLPDKELVTYTVLHLESASIYNLILYTAFDNAISSGKTLRAVTAPVNPTEFSHTGQNENSISLQWTAVNGIDNYRLSVNGTDKNLTLPDINRLVTYTVSGLDSASIYNLILYTVFDYAESSGEPLRAVTAPVNPTGFSHTGQNESSISLQWTAVNGISNYRLSVNGTDKNLTLPDINRLVTYTVSGLDSASIYNLILSTVFEYAESSGEPLRAVTAPQNPETFQRINESETNITLQWAKVKDISDYILVFNKNEIHVKNLTHTIQNLESGTEYDFSLFVLFENVRSRGTSTTASTVPPKVSVVHVTERFDTNATLTWEKPNKLWNYMVETNATGNVSINLTELSDKLKCTVLQLEPGTKYSFSVTTLFNNLSSIAYMDHILTKIQCDRIIWHVTNSSIEGTVEGLFSKATASNVSQTASDSTSLRASIKGKNVSFTDLYPGATYTISLEYVVSSNMFPQCVTDPIVTIIPPTLSGYCKNWASGYSALIVWDLPNGVWTDVRINMADQSDTVDRNKSQYIINGLQPAKTYKVSLVSISSGRQSEPSNFICATDNRGVIAGSVIGVLLFGIIVCMVVFILLKRPDIISRKKSFLAGSTKTGTGIKAISAAKFPDHFNQLSLDDNRGFSQEYEELASVGTDQTRKAAILPENKRKNRFTNILPYDWCRVKLSTSSPDDIQDYINANYMPGYNRNREYIASQGPLPSTVKDFWRMIWEQKVKRIVMVTNCTEAGRVKCEQYWPKDQQSCVYGEIVVTITSEEKEPNWTLREFRVKNRDSSEERKVKHFHFTAWPDHGVPQGTEVLIQFRALMRKHIESEGTKEPTVVHCSAGVGRTGTIIALDVLLQQLEKERAVGINNFVRRMRQHRSHMVQTESQYVFLHQCIMDSLNPTEKQEENIYENADLIYANATALQEFHNHNA